MLNYGRVKDALTMSTEPFPGSEDPLVSLVRPINSWEDYNSWLAERHRIAIRFPAQRLTPVEFEGRLQQLPHDQHSPFHQRRPAA